MNTISKLVDCAKSVLNAPCSIAAKPKGPVFTPYSRPGLQQAANFEQIWRHLRNTAPERLLKPLPQSLKIFNSIVTADLPNFKVDMERKLPAFEQIPSTKGAAKIEIVKNAESEAISKMISTFKSQFQGLAANKEKFHDLLRQLYAGTADVDALRRVPTPLPYSEEKAEALRQRALAGDYTWLPRIEFVSPRELEGRNGKYSPGPPATAYLNNRLLKDPEQAADSFIRAIGYELKDLTFDQDRLEEVIQKLKELPPSTQYWGMDNWLLPGTYEQLATARGNEGEAFRSALTGQRPLDKPEGWPWL